MHAPAATSRGDSNPAVNRPSSTGPRDLNRSRARGASEFTDVDQRRALARSCPRSPREDRLGDTHTSTHTVPDCGWNAPGERTIFTFVNPCNRLREDRRSTSPKSPDSEQRRGIASIRTGSRRVVQRILIAPSVSTLSHGRAGSTCLEQRSPVALGTSSETHRNRPSAAARCDTQRWLACTDPG